MKHTAFIPFLALLFLFITPFVAPAQPGCTDPQATNFNAVATSNDGSCLYPVTNYAPIFKAMFPDILMEVSGHTRAGSLWWAHNDGSDGSNFYRFNPESGAVIQEVKLQNASNKDWEDIASTNTHLYLGDFGNNLNDRQDLGIYRVPLAQIGNGSTETVDDNEWTFIPFAYADQTDFTTLPADSTVFDCEAMICLNGKIHLFTKNRKEYTTTHYVVNQTSGLAEKLETFDTGGLITGADISPDGKIVALLGYNLLGFPKVFCWLLWDWPAGSDMFFGGNKRRIELGSAFEVGQAEGIGFAGNRTGYITNERTIANGITFVEESVRYFDFGQWIPEGVGTGEPTEAERFKISPNPFSQVVRFQFFENQKPDFLQVLNQTGQVVLRLNDIPEMLDVAALPPGLYTFEAAWPSGKTAVFKGMKT